MAEGEPEEILRALDQAEELSGTAECRARTYLAAHGLFDHTNRDLRLLVLEVRQKIRAPGSSSGSWSAG